MLHLHMQNTGVNRHSAAPKSELSDSTPFFEGRTFMKTQVGRDVLHRLATFKRFFYMVFAETRTRIYILKTKG